MLASQRVDAQSIKICEGFVWRYFRERAPAWHIAGRRLCTSRSRQQTVHGARYGFVKVKKVASISPLFCWALGSCCETVLCCIEKTQHANRVVVQCFDRSTKCAFLQFILLYSVILIMKCWKSEIQLSCGFSWTEAKKYIEMQAGCRRYYTRKIMVKLEVS